MIEPDALAGGAENDPPTIQILREMAGKRPLLNPVGRIGDECTGGRPRGFGMF
jgi:hypothetical protein